MNNRNAELRLTVSQSGSVTAVFGVHVQIVGTEQVVVKISRLSGTHSLQCTVVLHALNAGFVGLWTGMFGPGGPQALGVGYGWRAGEDIVGVTAPTTCNGWIGNSSYIHGRGGDPTNSSGSFLVGGGGICVLSTGETPSQLRFLCAEQ